MGSSAEKLGVSNPKSIEGPVVGIWIARDGLGNDWVVEVAPACLESAWPWALLAVGLPHHGLLAEWLGLGPAELLGWQHLPSYRFGPAVQQGLLLHWAGPPARCLLWQLPSSGPPAQGLGSGPGPLA